jgi:hypothetical protein
MFGPPENGMLALLLFILRNLPGKFSYARHAKTWPRRLSMFHADMPQTSLHGQHSHQQRVWTFASIKLRLHSEQFHAITKGLCFAPSDVHVLKRMAFFTWPYLP